MLALLGSLLGFAGSAAANNTIGTYKLNSLEISPWE